MTEILERELLGALLFHCDEPMFREDSWMLLQEIQPEAFTDSTHMAIYAELRRQALENEPMSIESVQKMIVGIPGADLTLCIGNLVADYVKSGSRTVGEIRREIRGAQFTVTPGGLLLSEGFECFECFESIEEKMKYVFDIHTLPSKTADYCKEISDSLQVSPDMVGPAAIGIASMAVQKKYCIHPLFDWYEPANLYIAVIAEPSERKSPAMKALMNPVYQYERQENERIKPDIDLYEIKKKILEGKISGITKAASNVRKKKNATESAIDEDELLSLQQELRELEDNAPSPMRLVVDDLTMEVLAKIMGQNHERIGIASTEGGLFNMLAGRYSDNPVIDLILKGYTGDRYVLDRIGRKGQDLSHPLISIVLYVQPHIISQIMENSEFVERGLNARFLYALPPSMVGERNYEVPQVNPFIARDYEDIIVRLFSIPIPDTPIIIEPDQEAHEIAKAYFYEVEDEIKNATTDAYKAWLGKHHGSTMRIALVLHCLKHIEQSGNKKIDKETMENAVVLGRYFREQALYIFNTTGLNDSQDLKDARYILKRLDSTGKTEIKLRDLHQLCRSRRGLEKAESMIPGLNVLVRHGYIKINSNTQNSQNTQKGGRPSDIVYVNPKYRER